MSQLAEASQDGLTWEMPCLEEGLITAAAHEGASVYSVAPLKYPTGDGKQVSFPADEP